MAGQNTVGPGPDNDAFYKIPWCKCGECYAMTAEAEETCCIQGDQPSKCQTKVTSFIDFAREELTKQKLDQHITQSEVATWAYSYKKGENADYRRIAYDKLQTCYAPKHLTDMYTKDWGSNRDLPSCVKWHIRKLFPEADGKYTGYFPKSDDLLELTVSLYTVFEKRTKLTTKVVDIVRIREEFGPLLLTVPCDLKDEVIRMGGVSLVATFEAFAHDALKLSFDVGFSKMMVKEPEFIGWLEKLAPQDPKLKQNFYGQMCTKFSVARPEPAEIFARLTATHNERDTVTVMQTIIKTLRKTYRYFNKPIASTLAKTLEKAIVEPDKDPSFPKPVLGLLMKRFAAEKEWSVVLPSGDKRNIKIENFETLECLSKFFYGIRCIHAHGDAERTTKGRNGALSTLVMDDDTLKISSTSVSSSVEDVKKYFKDALEDLKKNGKATSLDNGIYETMRNFYILFADILGQVCGCVVYYNLRQFGITSNGDKGRAFNLTIPELNDAITTPEKAFTKATFLNYLSPSAAWFNYLAEFLWSR